MCTQCPCGSSCGQGVTGKHTQHTTHKHTLTHKHTRTAPTDCGAGYYSTAGQDACTFCNAGVCVSVFVCMCVVVCECVKCKVSLCVMQANGAPPDSALHRVLVLALPVCVCVCVCLCFSRSFIRFPLAHVGGWCKSGVNTLCSAGQFNAGTGGASASACKNCNQGAYERVSVSVVECVGCQRMCVWRASTMFAFASLNNRLLWHIERCNSRHVHW